MEEKYSLQAIQELEKIFRRQHIHRPLRIKRYDSGTKLTYDITGAFPAVKGKITLLIEKYAGGGFAGQVYKVKALHVNTPEGKIPGLDEGKVYAVKFLIPTSGITRLFRNIMYGIAYQGPFSLQLNPDAARAGALWQKFIRRGAKQLTGSDRSVVNILATLIDTRLGSCGEISEWVDGRMWRFEADDNLEARKQKRKANQDSTSGSPEYLSKKKFMAELVRLMHDMGAPELARQYEWWTCKSQPNVMKRLDSDPDPEQGHVAVDFRAGLALLPFLPQSPGDFRLILKGLTRGNLVQFDRGNLKTLKKFTTKNKDLFSDMTPALVELEEKDSAYRSSLPDITHHHLRLFYKRSLWSSILNSAVTGWKIRNFIDEKTWDKLQKKGLSRFLFYILGLFPFLGKFLRKIFGNRDFRKHYGQILTSPGYFMRASRARIAENLIRWHRAGRINAQRTARLAAHPLRFYAHIPLSFLPVGLHRFFSDKTYAKQFFCNIFIRPVRLYFRAEDREKWLHDMVSHGEKNGMLSPAETRHILSQVKEPFIQKYLKSLAVHVCTIPVTQIISLIVAFVYVRLHPEFTWQQATMSAGLILGLFQVTPISPGSIARGLYVTFLILRERNFKDYNIAFFLSFFKYIGYLAFPIQMAYHYPELARFMAGHWATGAVHIVPVFGEHGALLEHTVFDLFYNFPLTVRRRIRIRREKRSSLRPRAWHISLYVLLGTGLFAAVDLFFYRFNGHLPRFGDIWWIGIWIPILFSAAVSFGSGGISLIKRIFYGAVSGTIIGLFYAILNKAILPVIIYGQEAMPAAASLAGGLGLSLLKRMILFSVVAVLGALLVETRPLRKDY